MSFKSVLKSIEEGVLKGGAIVAQIEGLGPIVDPLLSAISPKGDAVLRRIETKADVTITDLNNIVKQIQVIGTQSGMTNDQKLAAEAALAGQLLQAFNHISDKNIGDATEVTGGVQDLMKAIVRIQNGLKSN